VPIFGSEKLFEKKSGFFANREISSAGLIVAVAVFLIAFDNGAFFSNILEVYPLNQKNLAFVASLAWVFGGFTVFLLSLVCFRYTIKPVLILLLLVSSLAGYFMDSYNTIIDDSMVNNVIHTDLAESLDLFSPKLLLYFLLLGVLPSWFVYKVRIAYRARWPEALSRIRLSVLSLLSIVAVIFAFSDFYSSFIREHKTLRYYANPTYYLYSIGKYIGGRFSSGTREFKEIGTDAKIPATDNHRELIVFVVGETARADRFSLNGYARETNPLLSKEQVVSYSNFWSCGTSTAVSVPCMFSIYGSGDYDGDKARATANVLDVLQHAGVNVLWLDNNSDSKGVAERIPYRSYKTRETNPACDRECRDIGMLTGLQDYIDSHPAGDLFIVLHQMGNHGPAYYKRYPPQFEKFTPVCRTNQLEECSKEEIGNAYDNAILYTDYFLSKVIGLLKRNDDNFETAMIYVSDHGESLGENGLYLHGLPNFAAPDVQRHVPAILWLGRNFDEVDFQKLLEQRNRRYSHDHLFHTILGFMEIETSIYDKGMDLLQAARRPDHDMREEHRAH